MIFRLLLMRLTYLLGLLLRKQKVEATLERHALARPLVIGREAGRVGRLGDLAVDNLLEGVDTAARLIESVHQMHRGSQVVMDGLSVGYCR